MENFIEAHDGHRERLRQKVQQGKLESLKPHEVAEFLLYYAIPRQDVNDLAHAILDKFKTVDRMFRGSLEDFLSVEGLGECAAEWMHLAGSCLCACEDLRLDPDTRAANYAEMFRYARRLRERMGRACAVQLCVDSESFIVHRCLLIEGRRWAAPESLAVAMDNVLSANARSVILVIMSPQARPRPSEYDIEMSKRYARLVRAARGKLLDVVLAGGSEIRSLRRMGLFSADNIEVLRPRRRLAAVCEDPLEDTLRRDELRVLRISRGD